MDTISVLDFGAVGDGLHDDTQAFEAVLSRAAKHGGTHVVVPAGTYLTGPLQIWSETTLEIQSGATIRFIDDFEKYLPVYSRWEGVECWCMHPCLFANGAHDVTVTGGGVLDGSGKVWWEASIHKRNTQHEPQTDLEKRFARMNVGFEKQPGGGGGRQCQFLRPPLVQFLDCSDVLMESVTLVNSPFWTLHPVYCVGVTIRDVQIKNPADAPNTDGIDIDSCTDVVIEDCVVDVGDDGIAIKSGSGLDGMLVDKPTQEVYISGCTVRNAHGGVVIGSETAAGIWDVEATGCLFDGTDRGIRIKTRRGRGGAIHDLKFRDLTMRRNFCPITINMYYRCGTTDMQCLSPEPLPLEADTPSLSGIRISNCHATDSRASAGFIVGLPEQPITSLVVEHCTFDVADNDLVSVDESEMFAGISSVEGRGIRCRNVVGTFIDVQVNGAEPPFIMESGTDITLQS